MLFVSDNVVTIRKSRYWMIYPQTSALAHQYTGILITVPVQISNQRTLKVTTFSLRLFFVIPCLLQEFAPWRDLPAQGYPPAGDLPAVLSAPAGDEVPTASPPACTSAASGYWIVSAPEPSFSYVYLKWFLSLLLIHLFLFGNVCFNSIQRDILHPSLVDMILH